jgi:flagellar basal-body rod protein FlgB
MSINFKTALGIHPDALMVHSKRAELLTSNIANADTPGYKAKDIDFKSVLNQINDGAIASGQLHSTHWGHQENFNGSENPEIMYRTPFQKSLDGNTVDGEFEYISFAENSLRYLSSLRFLSGKIQSLQLAIKGE